MMIEPQKPEYSPRHMKTQATEEVDLARLRELVDQLAGGTMLSDELEEVNDGQEDG